MLSHLRDFVESALPWAPTFNPAVLLFVALYVSAQLGFCVALRRAAMHIPGPARMCNPLGLWILAVPGLGALASLGVLRHVREAARAATDEHHLAAAPVFPVGIELAYACSRLLILVPGALLPALAMQAASAAAFLFRLGHVARALRTPDVAVR